MLTGLDEKCSRKVLGLNFFVLQTFTNKSRNLQRQKPFQNESNESNLRKKKSMATEIESPIKQV